jgi:asparagine synthase (glutamine-hydrolysing)
MSGICGSFRADGGPVDRDGFDRLLSALAPYGPDGLGRWIDGSVALGCARLFDTPESVHDQQPSPPRPPLPSTPRVITADVRLDNRDELCASLGVHERERVGMGDSQIVLAAYLRWGAECPAHLLGDFSFCVWDAPRRTLFCARDPMGVKPFYYRGGAQTPFMFSSDLRALVGAAPHAVDWRTMSGYLRHAFYYDAAATLYEGISKLPAGHTLEADRHGLRVAAYFRPHDAASVRYARRGEYAERLAELMHDAVRCRLRSAHPIATHLSGGLDSSAIAAIASRLERANGRRVLAYSYSSPPDAGDVTWERANIEAVCAAEGLACEYTNVSQSEAYAHLMWDVANGSPYASGPWDRQIMQRASSAGARVLLSGWGGDELVSFHGLGYYAELLSHGDLAALWRAARHRLQDTGSRSDPLARLKFVWRRALAPLVPDRLAAAMLSGAVQRPRFPPFLEPVIAQRLRLVRERHSVPLRVERRSVRRHQLGMLAYGHLPRRMETWHAEAAGPGVVHRYPLLDRRLVEFALGVPSNVYVDNGAIRAVFRAATRSVLPASVCDHRKVGPEASVERNAAARDAAARQVVDACLREPAPAAERRVICRHALRRCWPAATAEASQVLQREVLNALQCEAVLQSSVPD